MSARTYACSGCGAQVDEHARRCRFCASPIATVRCASCFHMNVPESGFCSGCGHPLGLEPVGEAGALACPACKTPLESYRSGAGSLFDCNDCGGQFVEHLLLQEMLHRHEHAPLPHGAVRSSGRPVTRTAYVPCPECHSLMNRKNFGVISGVIVDVCKKHGTWFGLGDLPRVLAFVATGGLERARARAAEEEARVHREAHVESVAVTPETPHLATAHANLVGGVAGTLAKRLFDLLLH
jgi:Zn-finger nucleic acid-binding protein